MRNVEWATATCVLGFGVFGKFWNGEGSTEDRNLAGDFHSLIQVVSRPGIHSITVWMVLAEEEGQQEMTSKVPPSLK